MTKSTSDSTSTQHLLLEVVPRGSKSSSSSIRLFAGTIAVSYGTLSSSCEDGFEEAEEENSLSRLQTDHSRISQHKNYTV